MNEWMNEWKIYIARLKAYKCMLKLPHLAENYKLKQNRWAKENVRPGVRDISPVCIYGEASFTILCALFCTNCSAVQHSVRLVNSSQNQTTCKRLYYAEWRVCVDCCDRMDIKVCHHYYIVTSLPAISHCLLVYKLLDHTQCKVLYHTRPSLNSFH